MNDFKMSRYTKHSALSNHSEVKRLKRFKFRRSHLTPGAKSPTKTTSSGGENTLTSLITCPPPSSSQPQRAAHGGSPTVATAAECVTGSLLPIRTNICTDQLQKKAVVFPKSIHTMDTLFSFSTLWEKIQDNKNQNKHEETASTMSC